MNTDASLGLEHTFATDLEGLYAPITPRGFQAPSLLTLNRPLASALGLDPDWLQANGAALLSGSQTEAGTRPLAQAYAGHQFGRFSPQLGDGRALLLGEIVDPEGKRFDLQLKGSGTTPFSRNGDGRAALDSALRESIVSEAMHALGVPTTRALAVVTTGETVRRQRPAPGAVLARVAASHLRVGTLEYFAARQDDEKLERLVRYALHRHYPEHDDAPNPAQALLDAVGAAQAKLVAQWMHVGFVHGVMNTDNVTLSGETIDYGPCAFMDRYDPQTVFSGIDHGGRYAFGNQPAIGGWNLARMAEALLTMLADDKDEAIERAQASMSRYGETLDACWMAGMRAKLGLPDVHEEDPALVAGLLEWMHEAKADYTRTFRRLSASLLDDAPAFEDEAFGIWNQRWRSRLPTSGLREVADGMDRVNPVYIPRNHMIEAALDAAIAGDLGLVETLAEVLATPFAEQPGREAYAEPAPDDFGPYHTHCNT